MFSNPEDIRNHLRSDIVYETYSDAKLAKLYLENVDDFPVHVLSKVLNILLDPLFQLEDITFKSVGDIFTHISAYRREDLSLPNLGRQIPSRSLQLVSRSRRPPAIPLDVVHLVVDKMVENRAPLGVASMEEDWRCAYSNDVADFHAMSLVHPSWTPIARRGLRRRAIIPYHQLNNFLVSPLCSPWVTEVIIYWTVKNGTKGITPSDVYLFDALLRRVPNVHSLAFNTSLVWLRYRFTWNTGEMPPLRVDSCLELVARLLPSLENLWLSHFSPNVKQEVLSSSLVACRELRSLFALLPRIQSLKRLSVYGWKEGRGRSEVDLNEHPGTNLKTLELTDDVGLSSRALNWLIMPRNGFSLRSLSISLGQLRLIDYPLSNLQELRLYMAGDRRLDPSNILERYGQLVDLHLFVSYLMDLGDAVFPKNLENISFYMSDAGLRCLIAHRSAYSSTSRRFSSNFVPLVKERLSHLQHLRSLRLIGAPSVEDIWRGNQNAAIECFPEGEIPGQFLDLSEEHGIDLVCGQTSPISPRY